MNIKKKDLKRSKIENVRRLAKYIRFHDIDDMSDRHLIKLLTWYYGRREKRMRNLVWSW